MRLTLLIAVAALPWGNVQAQRQPLDSAAIAALQRVLRLPRTTADAREAGVADSMIRVVLDEVRRRRLPASDAQEVVEVETEAVKAGAPKDNFGAFVQAQLAAGKRGRALAEAIRAEHAKRGHGPKRPDVTGAAPRGGPPAGARGGRPSNAKGKSDSAARGKGDSARKGKGRGR